MDSQTRSQYAEAGRKKLEEFRKKKAAEKAASAAGAAAETPAAPTALPAAAENEAVTIPNPPLLVPENEAETIETYTAAKEPPSWPSPTPGGASAAAAAAAAAAVAATSTTAPWTEDVSTATYKQNNSTFNANKFDEPLPPPQSGYLLYHNYQIEPEDQDQGAPPSPPPDPSTIQTPDYDVSSFTSYTNLLADPLLSPLPPIEQEHFNHHQQHNQQQSQPLFEPSTTAAGAGAAGAGAFGQIGGGDIGGIDSFSNNITEDVHHHSSFLASMNVPITSNSIYSSHTENIDQIEKPTLIQEQQQHQQQQQNQEQRSSSASRSVRTSSPAPSSRTPTTATATTLTTSAFNKGTEADNTTNNNNASNGEHSIATTTTTRPKDFKELQHHIGELTEEKFALQRCLEQQTALADRLAAENEALVMQVNVSGRAVEEARQELEIRRREVAVTRTETARAMEERDAYEMGAREASERAKTLAIEVVALEEKVLRMKSDQLKFLSEKEKADRGGDSSSSNRDTDHSSAAADAAAAVMAAERKVEMLSSQLKAANRQIEELKRDQIEKEQHMVRIVAEMETLREKVGSRENETNEAAYSASEGAETSSVALHKQHQQHVSDTPNLHTAATATKSSSGRSGENSSIKGRNEIKQPLVPPASALIAGEAMVEAEKISQDEVQEEEVSLHAVPAEIRALLPPAVWSPGAQGLDPSVNDLVERIYEVVGLLEIEKNEAAAALAAQRQTNGALQARLEALQASQELAIQERELSMK